MHDKIQDEFFAIKLTFKSNPIANYDQREFVLSRHDLLVMLAQSWQRLYEIVQEDLKFAEGVCQFPLKNSSPNEWLDFAQLLVQSNHHNEQTPKLTLDVGGRKIFVRIPSDRYAYDIGELPLYAVRTNLPVLPQQPNNNSIVIPLDKNDFAIIRDPNQIGKDPLKNQHDAQRFTYPDIVESLKKHYGSTMDDRIIVQQCRLVLSGQRLQPGHAKVIPLLLAILFGSEVSRNRACLLTGIMLFDLIEAGVRAPTEENSQECYTLENSLWHPKLYGTTKKERSLNPLLYALSLLGGFHPMAHLDSWKGEFKEEGPYQQNVELTTAHIKSIMILIDWLRHLRHPMLEGVTVTKLNRDQYQAAQTQVEKHFDHQQETGKIRACTLRSINHLIIASFLFPLIKERMSSFTCMLPTTVNPVVILVDQRQIALELEAERKMAKHVQEYEQHRNRFFEEARKSPVIEEALRQEIDQINDGQNFLDFIARFMKDLNLDNLSVFTNNNSINYRTLAELIVKLSLLKPPFGHSLTTFFLNLQGQHLLACQKLVLCTKTLFNKFKTSDTSLLILLRQLSSQLPLPHSLITLLFNTLCVANLNELTGEELFEITNHSRDDFILKLMIDEPVLFRKMQQELFPYLVTEKIVRIVTDRNNTVTTAQWQKIIDHNYSEMITAYATEGLGQQALDRHHDMFG